MSGERIIFVHTNKMRGTDTSWEVHDINVLEELILILYKFLHV